MGADRLTRVNELLQRELGNVFTMVVSPAVPYLVTVTGVKTAVNLRDATVYVSIYGYKGAKEKALDFLEKKRALIQSELAHRIILKYTPRLHFKLDETAENAERVMAILNELHLDDEGKEDAR